MRSEESQLFDKRLVRRLLFPAGLAVVAYALILSRSDASAVVAGVSATPASSLGAGIGLSLLSFALRICRWQVCLARLGLRLPRGRSVLIFLVGLGMTITPGKVGEVIKPLLLKQHFDVPVARSMPILVAERLLDVVSLTFLGLLGYAVQSFPRYSPLLLALLVAPLLLVRWRLLKRLVSLAVVLFPALARFQSKLETVQGSLQSLWALRTYTVSLGCSLAAWACQAATVPLFVNGIRVVEISPWDSLVVYAAPLLAGALALLPGGLGVAEASMIGTLQALIAVSPAEAATVTILVRLVTFWLAVLLGLLAFAWVTTWRSPRV